MFKVEDFEWGKLEYYKAIRGTKFLHFSGGKQRGGGTRGHDFLLKFLKGTMKTYTVFEILLGKQQSV